MNWDLDDNAEYVRVHSFEIPAAFTYDGRKDREKRNYIREVAAEQFPDKKPAGQWWAFRVYVKKKMHGERPFDIENVSKLVVDAFSEKQIKDDKELTYLGRLNLFKDDTLEEVRILQLGGEPSSTDPDAMIIEIFRRRE